MDVLMVVVTAGNIVGFPCLVLRLVPIWRTAGVFAVGNGAGAVDELLHGQHLMFAFNGSMCLGCAWTWWKGGGGDGTRRRLRSLARVFRGVRRTAPVTGGAS